MLEYTWRWFGPNDRITFDEIRQTGVTGIVTALHQVPAGEIWSKDNILERKNSIENAGFRWSVVESLPIHEDIKRRSGNYKAYIANYKESLKNLAAFGIDTVCYNFMPVLDWSRTNLLFKFEDHSQVTGFDFAKFVAFDLHILQREGAKKSYSEDVFKKANEYFSSLSLTDIQDLENTVLLGLPGSGEEFTLEQLRDKIRTYENIDNRKLKSNLFDFLREIIPVAEEKGIRLAIHPDDPPWALMGLPRIVSTEKDLEEIIAVKDSPVNGFTLCTGSLGAGYFNDIPAIAKKFSYRINFAHLRNVTRDEELNFNENYLFDGDVDMYEVMLALVQEMNKRKKENRPDWQIPMRPDHGNQMLGDIGRENYPGYGLYGRMKSIAEIRGLELGISRTVPA
ncbi:Mannonate dehydratase [subsurface metagenome]